MPHPRICAFGFTLLTAALPLARGVAVGSDSSDFGVSVGSGSQLSVFTGYDASNCSSASSGIVRVNACDESYVSTCTAYQVGAGTTYYAEGACSDSREAYLEATFGDSALFMVEYYEDVHCAKLTCTDVYAADAKCHYFTLGVMQIWTAADKSMAALTVNSDCDAIDWSVFMELNVSVNTGECIPQQEYSTKAVKFVLVGEPPYFDPFASASTTDTKNTTTTATVSSPDTSSSSRSSPLTLFTLLCLAFSVYS